MSKRRKLLVIIGLIALAAVCFVMLQPRDEPKYQGRYLSEWMAAYDRGNDTRAAAAELAVRVIGTNALPCFLEWMRYEPHPWRASLGRKLPSWIRDNRTVGGWINGPLLLPMKGNFGIVILGTNAFVAMPELEAIMRDRTKPQCSSYAKNALSMFGEPAIPIFQTTLADPHQAGRVQILEGIAFRNFNKYLPVFVAALTNDDAGVRSAATNAVSRIAPELLTNAPAP